MPLKWHEWVNVGVVVVFGQGLQIVLVTVAVVLALVVLGTFLMPGWLQAEWAGGPVGVVASFDLLGSPFVLTIEAVAVAVMLGAFSGLYFTVSALSDATYRAEFFDDADRELERVFAVRTVYGTALALYGTAPAPADEPAAAKVAAAD